MQTHASHRRGMWRNRIAKTAQNRDSNNATACKAKARRLHRAGKPEWYPVGSTHPKDQRVQQHAQQGECHGEYARQNIAIVLCGQVRQALRLHVEKRLENLPRSRPGHLGPSGGVRTANGFEIDQNLSQKPFRHASSYNLPHISLLQQSPSDFRIASFDRPAAMRSTRHASKSLLMRLTMLEVPVYFVVADSATSWRS